ncbi:hypothetical protein I547_6738 [Mycobacterium kansasii 824]|nr:hypothetical protein I547_6738 [Mycobacterium kansasii 824]
MDRNCIGPTHSNFATSDPPPGSMLPSHAIRNVTTFRVN